MDPAKEKGVGNCSPFRCVNGESKDGHACAHGETLHNPTTLSFCWQTEPRLSGTAMENLELGAPHSCSQSYSQKGTKECSTTPKTTLFSAALTKYHQTLLSVYLLFPLHSYESTDTIMILP